MIKDIQEELGLVPLNEQQQQSQRVQKGPPYVDLSGTGLDPESPEAADYIGNHIGEQLQLRGIAIDG